MSKAIIWLLLSTGLFFLFIGLLLGWKPLLLLGLVSIGGGLFLGLGPDGILRKDQILDSWANLISNGEGKAQKIFESTETFIKDNKAPLIDLEKRSVSPGLIKGILGKDREFLIATDKESVKLRPYKIYINARDYGKNLDVSWYLTFKPGIIQAIASLLPFSSAIHGLIGDLDLFDQQDLRAYASIVHSSVLSSVDKVMLELHQDPLKIERKSRGFLGIT